MFKLTLIELSSLKRSLDLGPGTSADCTLGPAGSPDITVVAFLTSPTTIKAKFNKMFFYIKHATKAEAYMLTHRGCVNGG